MLGPYDANTPSATDFRRDYEHTPVLVAEILAHLHPRAGGIYVDATVGEGGHAAAILETSAPSGQLIGIDRDADVLAVAQRRLAGFGSRVQLLHSHARDMRQDLDRLRPSHLEGILLDLGMSSYQLAHAERGFSFTREGPLDMRMDQTSESTAAILVNTLGEDELATLIQRYGEERWAPRIARAIVRARRRSPLRTTQELAALVTQVIPPSARPPRIHPATRTFQALRIAVNQELATLEITLQTALTCLSAGGRLCVIAYHSLEDRIVKRTFRAAEASDSSPSIRVLTRKPVTPSAAERRQNPRARSAKLRVAEHV
ncbi:MAG: 16S rRNA (cytosine(1402)-N(4))-methyltransferase RsmH [Candidatus Entotheonellia bacterium]